MSFVGRPSHGDSGTRLHRIWKGIKGRTEGHASAFRFYGARGVSIAPEWQIYEPFREWATANGYSGGRQIDRIDADGPYSPENCRWVLPIVNYARKELPRDGSYLTELTGHVDEDSVARAPLRAVPWKLHDGGGLFLHLFPSGRRVWRMKFTFEGREQLLTFGVYPALSISEARELRMVARCRLDRGVNPAQLKRASQQRSKRRRRAKELVFSD